MGHMSFRLKLTLVFIVTVMIEGALIGGFSYYHSRDIVVRNKKQEMSDTINRIDININVKVRYIMEVLDSAADSELVRGACLSGWDQGERSIRRTYLDDYCASLIKSIGEQMDISIISRSGILYTTGDAGTAGLKDISGEMLAAYYDAVGDRHNKAVWAGIMPALIAGPEQERQVVTVARAIMDQRQDRVLGIMVIELDPDMFSNLLLGNQGLFQYQYLFIVDQKGEVICSNPKVDKGWQEEIDDRFERGIRRFDLEWRGKEYYVCGQYNGITGWKSYSAIPAEGLFPQAKDLSSAIWLVVMMCTIGIAGIIAVLVYAMARPIKRLSGAMSQVQEGDFTVRVPNRRKDEIGELTDSFNYMVDKINTLIRQVYQEKIAQKNAEVQALQAQINPHFLYNTLENIRYMCRLEPATAERMVFSLSNLLRYSLDGSKDQVTLKEDLEHLENYMTILKRRFGSRLEYQIEVEPEAMDCRIPKLVLQPMIENAVKYGFGSQLNLKVELKAYIYQGNLIMICRDDGVGISQENLSELNAVLEQKENTSRHSGLYNIHRRIAILYGRPYGVEIRSTEGHGTTLVVTLPADREPSWGPGA